MDIRYGLLHLGEIQAFLRDIIGDDVLYMLTKREMELKRIPFKEKDSCRKAWDRYCKEEVQDYIDYLPTSENSISYLILRFLEKLQKEYDFSSPIGDFIVDLCNCYYQAVKEYSFKIYPGYSYTGECRTSVFSCMIFYASIFVSISSFSKENNNETVIDFIQDINELSYESLFEQLRNELNCKSLEKLYEKLGYEESKRIISSCRKRDLSPSWNYMEKLTKCCSNELKNKFLTKYLLRNIIESAKKHLLISDKDLLTIKKSFSKYLEEKKNF